MPATAITPMTRAAAGVAPVSDAALQPWLLLASVAMIVMLVLAHRLVMRRR